MNEYELIVAARHHQILWFCGVFGREELKHRIPYIDESGIIDLGTRSSGATHWTGYIKCGDEVDYFEPLENLRPPEEVENYF